MGKKLTLLRFAFILSICGWSCKKDWLDAKPDQNLVVPATLKDFQSLLDYADLMNLDEPNLGELGSDDYYITDVYFNTRSDLQKNVYSWSPTDIFAGTPVILDWTNCYRQVYVANIALEGVEKIDISPSNHDIWNNVKGSGLFYRAYAFYNLAQVFCKPFIQPTSTSDPGIVLRLESNINVPSARSTVQQTYDQIVNDLLAAKDLLPVIPLFKTRPSKPAAYAMLARTYLLMGYYDKALLFADSCLQLHNSLIDYNLYQVNPLPDFRNNPEVIFHGRSLNSALLPQNGNGQGIVDSVLYRSYSSNDLRKTVFFKTVSGVIKFYGSYYGGVNFLFNGLATDEIYLIRAECFARTGNIISAMKDLNTLLQKRWRAGFFVPVLANDANDALVKILVERRKELCFRSIRWTDLRRLNIDPRFSVTLKRIINGQLHTLPPNDNRYVYPIPDDEILNSGIVQNSRK